MSDPTVPYESTEPPAHLPWHLERIAQRDYTGINEGYWVLRDAAAEIARLRAANKALVEAAGNMADAVDAFEALVDAQLYDERIRGREERDWPDDCEWHMVVTEKTLCDMANSFHALLKLLPDPALSRARAALAKLEAENE